MQAALLGLSLLVHVAVLLPLALDGLGRPLHSGPDVDPFWPVVDVTLGRPRQAGRQPGDRQAAPVGKVSTFTRETNDDVEAAPLQFDPDDIPSIPPEAALPSGRDSGASAEPQGPWRVRPGTPGDRIARSLRDGVVGCRSPELLSPTDRIACEDRFARTASRADTIPGTGDAERDARQVRQGAFQLSEYERRRAPLTPHSRARGCPGGEIKGTCPLMIPLLSSSGGFLPTLRPGRDE